MAFRKKFEEILLFKPDLMIVIECERQDKLQKALKDLPIKQILWYGDNQHKGIGVISFVHFPLRLYQDYNDEFRYVIPLIMETPKPVYIFVIWAMPHEKIRSRSYVGQIWAAIQYYTEELDQDSILIGDFNSNAIWDKSKRNGNHSDVVSFLQEKNIYSLYHEQTLEKPGSESLSTLFMYRHLDKPYHMDYCFVSKRYISEHTNIEIGRPNKWLELSDHMPIIIDIEV